VNDKKRDDTVIVHMNWCGFTAFGHTLKRNMLVQSSHRSYLCCHLFHKRMIFISTVLHPWLDNFAVLPFALGPNAEVKNTQLMQTVGWYNTQNGV